MASIKLLDCTLRDGGYVNDWRFGCKEAGEITEKLFQANIDYIEMGFLREQAPVQGRMVFSSAEAIEPYISSCLDGVSKFCAMSEAVGPLPLEKLDSCDGKSIGIVRVIVWKRLLEEGFEYCKGIVERGYQLCVQPNRIDQYSMDEFRDMLHKFGALSPLAIYLVDSFGLLHNRQILEYARLADREMSLETALGFHGHNNMQQVFSTAVDLLYENYDRDIILDASVFGIGRGAGNLCTELIAQYLNEYCGKNYDVEKLLEINEKYIQSIYENEKWGYRTGYYLTARHKCNPMYGFYYGEKWKLPGTVIDHILETLSEIDKIIFTEEKAIRYARAQGVRCE